MAGHLSPSLFITVYGLYGCPKEFGYLFLGFVQGFAKVPEFFVIHFMSFRIFINKGPKTNTSLLHKVNSITCPTSGLRRKGIPIMKGSS
jgi:hypothetical protein